MSDRPIVVAFDFDATLTLADSVVPFMRRFTHPMAIAGGLALRPVRTVRSLAGRDRNLLRSIATEIVFRGRPHAEVCERAEEHAGALVDGGLRDDTTRRLDWHLEHGHQVVIVSASYEDYLVHVAKHLGAHDVIGTRLEVIDGVCSGRLAGPNCRGPEKVRRLTEWLAADGRHRDDVELWAYGDSPGDRELLAWADRPFWVDRPLATVAP